MDTKYIESVLAVAEYLSFSRAAEAIHCAQSSISRQVKAVEEELGAQLFTRAFSAGRVELTAFGEKAIPLLRETNERLNILTDLARRPKDREKITFRLGLYRGPFNSAAKSKISAEIFMKHPDMNIIIQEVPLDKTTEFLSKGVIDAAVLYRAYFRKDVVKPIRQQIWLQEEILFSKIPCIAMTKSHSLAGCKSINFSDLRDETILLHHRLTDREGSKYDVELQGFLDGCLDAGFTPKVEVLPIDTIADIRDAAVLAYGWMYPSFATKIMRDESNISFVPIRDSSFYATYYMVYTKAKADVAKLVVKDIRSILSKGDHEVFE